MTEFAPIVERLVDENSPEAKLLRQRLRYLGVICIAIAVIGLMLPTSFEWQLEATNAIIIAVIGFVLVVIDLIDTYLGLREAARGAVISHELVSSVTDLQPVQDAPTSAPELPGIVG